MAHMNPFRDALTTIDGDPVRPRHLRFRSAAGAGGAVRLDPAAIEA